MNVHFTYKQSKTSDLEQLINQQVEKLRKRLQVFKPDMVSLHGTVTNGSRVGSSVSLNLRLPSGQMAAKSTADTAAAAVRATFDDLVEQLDKHKAQLRAQHAWPRQRRAEKNPISVVPFETTVAAVHPTLVSEQDITSFVNADLGRLLRFVERELRFRVNAGDLRSGQLTAAEVVDETIANALDDSVDRPEKLALEPWLYHLARLAIDRLSSQTTSDGFVSLDDDEQRDESTEEPEEGAEAVVHLHHREQVPEANLIADASGANPEERTAMDEVAAMVDIALREVRPEERQAFILFVFEGFSVEEISAIMEMDRNEVHQAIRRARERVRHCIPAEDRLKTELLVRAELA